MLIKHSAERTDNMTYYELYQLAKTEKELKDMMKRDAKLACMWKFNPARIKAIEDAGNKIAKERNW